MSLKWLKKLNHGNSGLLADFISSFGDREPRICWYPSAGHDLRDLVYLSREFHRFCPPTADKAERIEQVPDLFVHTDYWIGADLWFAQDIGNGLVGSTDKVIFEDDKTTIGILALERLPDLPLPRSRDLVHFPEGGALSNRVYFLELEATSGARKIRANLLYAFVENLAFCRDVLLPNQVKVAEIIHNRFGGGFGGGHARGGWLLHVLEALGCEIFITDGRHLEWSDGDRAAMDQLIAAGHCQPAGRTPVFGRAFREIDGRLWSGYGDKVEWLDVQHGD